MKDKELEGMVKGMFAQCCMQFANAFLAATKSPLITPIQASNAMYGTIGSIVHAIPDDTWKEMMDVKPCGGDGCKCHVHMMEFMTAVDKLRTVAIKVVAEKKGEQTHEM